MHRLAVAIACLLVLAPRLATALELGPIDVRSALYQPLDARIPIRDAQGGDLEGLNVVLGSPAQFELAGVARMQHLNLLEFTVVEQGEGGGYIHVRTEEPVIEPSLTFLIDVDWPRGRTVRGYRLHLSAAAGRADDSGPESPAQAEAQPERETGATRTESASGATDYGPVQSTETLWSIAVRMRPDRSVSVQRMMLAIVEANPNAFVIGNINGLRAGAMLRIPDRDEIGPDNLTDSITEVETHHSAWREYRKRRSTPDASSTPATEPLDDAEIGPGGRIEVVSPETDTGVTVQEEGTEVEALRKELALAMEEVDAGRRQNDELKLRLSEAEDHVTELNRLVALKNEEIAALQADLKALSEAATQPVPVPVPAEPAEADPRPVEQEPQQTVPESAETEQTPSPAAPMPDAVEPSAIPVPADAVPVTDAEAEPKTLPFGLGALPVNPVFLVGGAGLLLLLLGVLALLRRRRASAGEDDVLEVGDEPAPEEGELLVELEAVAAELADEQDDSAGRTARDGSPAVPDRAARVESRSDDFARSESEGLVEERIAELWRDAGDAVPERMVAADSGADEESTELAFDVDALAREDSDLGMRDVEADEDFQLRDLAEFVDEPDEALMETDRDPLADETMDRLDRFLDRDDAATGDTDESGSARRSDDGAPFGPDPDIPGDGRSGYDAPLATLDDHEPTGTLAGTSGPTDEGDDWSAEPVAERGMDFAPAADRDTDDSSPFSQASLDESTDGGETDQFSLEEFGEGEVQTKIDLAQVYMEMGDTESARGFLEAVLDEGDAEQQEVARQMLSQLA